MIDVSLESVFDDWKFLEEGRANVVFAYKGIESLFVPLTFSNSNLRFHIDWESIESQERQRRGCCL